MLSKIYLGWSNFLIFAKDRVSYLMFGYSMLNINITEEKLISTCFTQDKSMELLLEGQRQQVKTGKLPDIAAASDNEYQIQTSDIPTIAEPNSSILLLPSSTISSLAPRMVHMVSPSKPSIFDTPSKLGGAVNNSRFGLGDYNSPTVFHGSSFTNKEGGQKPQTGMNTNFKFDHFSTPQTHFRSGPLSASLKELNKSSSRLLQKSYLRGNLFDKLSPEVEDDGFTDQFKSTSPSSRRITANPATTPGSEHGLFKTPAQALTPNISGKRVLSDGPGRAWSEIPSSDAMAVSWR